MSGFDFFGSGSGSECPKSDVLRTNFVHHGMIYVPLGYQAISEALGWSPS